MVNKYTLEITDAKHPLLVKEESFHYNGAEMTSPIKIVNMVNELFRLKYLAEEHVYMCAFDTKMNVIGVFEVSHGSIDTAPASPRDIMMRALLSGASGIVILHNHPSQDTTPSNTDINVFKQLLKAFSICGLKLQDFIVVGDGHYSFKENSLFEI